MIKLFLSDLDGTCTSGGYIVPSNRDAGFNGNINIVGQRRPDRPIGFHRYLYFRQLNTKDSVGMKLLNEAGIKCMVISGSREPCIDSLVYLNPHLTVLADVQDKCDWVRTYIEHSDGKYSWDDIAFIGDEINDAKLLQHVGLAACPSDAVPEIIELVSNRKDGFVMSKVGGAGCVREFTDLIRKIQGIPTKWLAEKWERKNE
jgi:3-deoxy-D-manno-octulosonate 8-phosphate phosphatase (KDO 8-P phosphatase)